MSRENARVLFDILIAEVSRDMNALRDDEISKVNANWMLLALQEQVLKMDDVYLQGRDPAEGTLDYYQREAKKLP